MYAWLDNFDSVFGSIPVLMQFYTNTAVFFLDESPVFTMKDK